MSTTPDAGKIQLKPGEFLCIAQSVENSKHDTRNLVATCHKKGPIWFDGTVTVDMNLWAEETDPIPGNLIIVVDPIGHIGGWRSIKPARRFRPDDYPRVPERS